MTEQPKVIIRCLVYNHEPYLRDCLEGFVMQKTDFPFKAVVHDDCSTDGSAAIIREYAEKYPHIIEPIYETENQYSKRDGSLRRVMDAATLGRSPYIAYCEGDDYWIDPLKLQKQVDYMDSHPECMMCCTNAEVTTPDGVLNKKDFQLMGWNVPQKEGNVDVEDIILQGGWYLHTCTFMAKSNWKDDMPELARKCDVGDYPLMIFTALKGSVYYFQEKMAVYRYCSLGSWTSRNTMKKFQNKMIHTESIVNMLTSFDEYSSGRLHHLFIRRQRELILDLLINFQSKKKEILNSLGWVLKFKYQYSYWNDINQPYMRKILFFMKRLIGYPYHPNCLKYIRPALYPFSLLKRIKSYVNFVNIRSLIKRGE